MLVLVGGRLDLFLVPAMLVAIQAACLRLLRDTRRASCWSVNLRIISRFLREKVDYGS